jgi:hypothetical protein
MSDREGVSGRSVTITFSVSDFEKLSACAEYKKVSLVEAVREYVQDWIGVDYPASQGLRYGRREIYRGYP